MSSRSGAMVAAYVLSFIVHSVLTAGMAVLYFVFSDKDRTQFKSRRKDVAGLTCGVNLFLAALYAYLLFVNPSLWARMGDAVLIQWERWFIYIFAAALLGGACSFYLAMLPKFGWLTVGSFAMVSMFLLFGDITSYSGPFVWFLVAVIFWIVSVILLVVGKRRDADQRYWFVWIWVFIAPLFYAFAFLLGSPAVGDISLDLEIWLLTIGDLLLWGVFSIFLVFFIGGGRTIRNMTNGVRNNKSQKKAADAAAAAASSKDVEDNDEEEGESDTTEKPAPPVATPTAPATSATPKGKAPAAATPATPAPTTTPIQGIYSNLVKRQGKG